MNLERVIAVRTGKTVYHDGKTAVKVFEAGYSKADILNEALNQARVEESGGLHIPKILEVTSVEGKWAIVFEFVEGKTLERLMQEEPKKLDEHINLFVDLQLSMHKVHIPLLPTLRDKMERKIGIADLPATARYDLHTRLDALPRHSKLCHGDFNPSNVIIANDGTPYILDWSHATQGNAAADAARTYLLFWLAGNIDAADKYLKLFCEKSGATTQYVQTWMPIVAASQLAKAKPQEKEFLLSWVHVVDYE
jgi:aminoglycoside phosphotransferase (APT) family kinase protein